MLGERLAGVVFMDQNLVTHADLDVAVQTLRTRLDALGVHDFLGIAFTGMFTPDTPASLRERVLRRIPSIDARFARELLLDSLAWEAQVPELLSRLNVPVLLLQSTWLDERFEWRQLEPGMHTPWTRLVCSKVSDCEFQVVPGVGHFLMIEAPEVVAGHLEAFLKRLS